MDDGLGNQIGNPQTGTFGIEAIAESYGFDDYVMSMHIDYSHSMPSIWSNPDGVDGIDILRSPYGNYTNALLNYHWDSVLLEPYLSQAATFGSDKQAATNFINLTRQNPANQDTVFYVYQVWPQQSFGDLSQFWLGSSPIGFHSDALGGSTTTISWIGPTKHITRKASLFERYPWARFGTESIR